MIDGTTCSYCGQFFQNTGGGIYTHGYPVLCRECWDEMTKKDLGAAKRAGLQRALFPTL